MWIREIIERKEVFEFLEKRRLLKKYKKAKKFLLSDNYALTNLKKRRPKKAGIWSFRVDKQFRALCYFNESILIIFEIDNHQE